PTPGEPMLRAVEEGALVPGFASSTARDELERTWWPDRAAAVDDLYPDAPADLALRAAARLRPQARAPMREPWPLERLPAVETASIVCREDSAVSPSWSRRTARERLGVEPIELRGA